MATINPFLEEKLLSQIEQQKKFAWNFDTDIPWEKSIDLSKYLLPLDSEAILFPDATNDQRHALSHWMGLVVSATIAEMENVIYKFKSIAWEELIKSYPTNPEIRTLGELFFEEEEKHGKAFYKYISLYCEASKINPKHLDCLLPKAFGSLFQKATFWNAKLGGHAFWWVTAMVEEASIEIFKAMHSNKPILDPLFYEIHKKHAEEEARHKNYALLILSLIDKRPFSIKRFLHKKTDLLYSQIFSSGWILSQLYKVKEAKRFEKKHPFFKTLSSCLPQLNNLSTLRTLRKLFKSAPYVSLVLNLKHHKNAAAMKERHFALTLPFPEPEKITMMDSHGAKVGRF